MGYVVLRTIDSLPDWYRQLFHAFIILNTYYLALGFVYYSDKVAACSWSIVPLIVTIPVLCLQGWRQGLGSVGFMVAFLGWSQCIGAMDKLLNT